MISLRLQSLRITPVFIIDVDMQSVSQLVLVYHVGGRRHSKCVLQLPGIDVVISIGIDIVISIRYCQVSIRYIF